MRAVIDYVVGFVLLVFGVFMFRAPSPTAVSIAIGIIAVLVGLGLIFGRLIAGKNADRP